MPDPRIWPITGSEISSASIGAVSMEILAARILGQRADADFSNDST